MFNGDFLRWPNGTYWDVTSVGVRTAEGWYFGPGLGGRVIVSRRIVAIGEPGLPFNTRFCKRMVWLASYTPSQPDNWETVVEYGEAHGAPVGLGVREHAGKTVRYSLYVKLDRGQGPIACRLTAWQSFGTGPGHSPFPGELTGPVTTVEGGSWQKLSADIPIPALDSKEAGTYGDDYLGFGLDLRDGAAPFGMEVALAQATEL